VLSVLDKKVRIADEESRKVEKEFAKGGMDKRVFIENYLEKRKEFHKYQIIKVKVNQS
jgi:hypothetical protein